MKSFLVNLCFAFYLIKFLQAFEANTTNTLKNLTFPLQMKSKPLPDPMYYIAGGSRDDTSFQLIQYMVSIRSRNPQKYFGDNHFCAGTIITNTVVLTAAHCVMDKRRVLTRARRLLLVAGTPNRLEPIDTTIQFPAKSVVANTKFIRENKNDIAVIHLKGEIPEDNEKIKIIKMPTGPPVYGSNCTIIGWGRMIRKGPLAALPFHVHVRLYEPWECKNFLRDHYYEGILCAGHKYNYDVDPCRGDTGGPLICNEELTGVISWTTGCGRDRLPSLYTDVWYNREWIQRHLSSAAYLIITVDIMITLLFVLIFII